ncbi:hypothetical protein FNF27_01374 [Cafeteria roenbergensis]|uniref:Uncharacterized protein n=1 Tax=Cafeteria roenbergensis TaxID=33653 RepID=A0A5A8DEX3_CAFRO|nr:hypothetical protein FNF29_05829 [Cafeteria roenbergensis]KAA0163976.1 hypothetical protein FNF31_02525 [Cafeteria roenbergensis]KAA0172214.1 hypothetical protein FNF28_00217 [Cafeteria roenbergensis]KAA0177044.1 hypothetical protein FNF27_01374 [Cafeteria roenbergensis]|eukprot:KAA0149617.1 hypothetical protein FNF29_05829 [Cafeteria roenbergensis]
MAAVPATPDAAAATAPPIRAADHFPRVLKPCKAAAEPFFKCFSAATLDPNADGRAALQSCADSMKVYDDCMAKELKGKHTVLYHVPDAYKVAR